MGGEFFDEPTGTLTLPTISHPEKREAGVSSLPDLPFEPLPQFQSNALGDSPDLADCRRKRIGILVVTYNAVTTLNKVLKRITPDVWRNVEQVVVFDDASQDATYELAVGIQTMSRLPKLRVLKHSQNLGYGGNQKAGYQYFIEQGFDIVVLLHGDGQYAPELLAHMYAPLVRGDADAVFGSRMMRTYGGPLKGGMPLYKYLGNRVLTAFENRTLGLDLSEFHSGYRAYNLHALNQIRLRKLTDDFHFDTEIIIKLHHQRFRIAEVPVPTFYGDEICYVNGMKYAKAIVRAVHRYVSTSRSVRSFPEYEEYFVPYKVKQSLYSSHYYLRRLVGTGANVLVAGNDIDGFSEELREGHNQVSFLPLSPLAGYPFHAAQYDQILLIDTLEHLADPGAALDRAKPLLGPHGKLIVSVPNAVNLSVRLRVLFGYLDYSDRGIFDWSHLRFFTGRTIRRLLKQHGYRVTETQRSIIPLERLLAIDPQNKFFRAVNHLLSTATRLLPNLLAYEIILQAEPEPEPAQRS